jgi:hypothetical protein
MTWTVSMDELDRLQTIKAPKNWDTGIYGVNVSLSGK